MPNKIACVFGLVLTLLVLAACGGGTSSSSNSGNPAPVNTVGAAQGVYSGTSSAGFAFQAMVLPNDKYYAVYGTSSSTTFLVYGLMVGQGNSSTSTYTGTYTDFYYTGVTYAGTISANYVAGSSLNGSYAENSSNYTFTASAMPASSFNYNTAASLSAIVGTWPGTFLDDSPVTITVSSSGAFTGLQLGCSFSGSLTPDSSGKNFHNMTVTFGGSPCSLPNQTATGIAISFLESDGIHHQLLMAGTSGNVGTLFIGEK